MSRLLHAAARGARIQHKVHYNPERWDTFRNVLPILVKNLTRIHPDDSHLQYGPITTALRHSAMTGKVEKANLPYLIGFLAFEEEQIDYVLAAPEDLAMFKLILAEYLADLGL